MKINSIMTNTGYLKSRTNESLLMHGKECAKERHNLKQYNNDKINTTIKRNPDGRASFKGGSGYALYDAALYAHTKSLIAEALFAISITCFLRPLTIMATAKSEEDKEKCHYQAAKSIASGVIGLAATALIGKPTAAATMQMEKAGGFKIPETVASKAKQALENPKTKENAEKVLKNYSKTAKNVMDKVFQPIFMPTRAKMTIMAVPAILGAIGIRKSSKKHNDSLISNNNYNIFQNENEKILFGAIAGVLDDENK